MKPRSKPLRSSSSLSKGKPKRTNGLAASPAQRKKVAGLACVSCDSGGTAMCPIDPAHLIDRSLGGCDDPDCTVALCRRCHDEYDEHALDLSIHLEPAYRAEVAHAVMHVGLWRAVRRLSGLDYEKGRAV